VTSGRRSQTAGVIALVVYLCAAGWFFVLAPWSRFWTTRISPGAPLWLLPWLQSPTIRGAFTGFGIVHFAVAYIWLATITGQR
jgi:hypothetical protein